MPLFTGTGGQHGLGSIDLNEALKHLWHHRASYSLASSTAELHRQATAIPQINSMRAERVVALLLQIVHQRYTDETLELKPLQGNYALIRECVGAATDMLMLSLHPHIVTNL